MGNESATIPPSVEIQANEVTMYSNPAVIWRELPSLTKTVADVDPVGMWDQSQQMPGPTREAWSVFPFGEYHEAPLALDTDRFASPDDPDMRMDTVTYQEAVNASSIPVGDVFLHYPAASTTSSLTYVVAGEPFQLDLGADDSDHCILQHRHWSLCGFGNTLEDAVQDLLATAQAVAPDYLQLDPSELTDNARSLRAFLQRVF